MNDKLQVGDRVTWFDKARLRGGHIHQMKGVVVAIEGNPGLEYATVRADGQEVEYFVGTHRLTKMEDFAS